MQFSSQTSIKTILRHFFIVLVAIALALFWVLLSARPAFAQSKTVNYTHTHLENRDFSNTDLTQAVFAAAEMQGANFSNSNLSNAILSKANLTDANLTGAKLGGVLADSVIFYRSNLTNAILVEATLTGSVLQDAEVTGADFTDALIDRYDLNQLCKRAEGINPVTGVATRDSLGCR
ncbi:pentapeptide repeat-containing protein [Kovacikia minuta CCNUW1]|uniref:pentapeptide repeat-containing protein n=1 Tax=Kovacikia minuta TaxID=2931930 RepID=UPI001CCBC870|nr:pentapeptide repeat-containing protein [Kovacikia minuta]UBF24968.1 pentapeptide repeat-containing protein [Kovacikia minuta CCNUW1]